MRKKVIVVSGPTASGKSAAGDWLVNKLDCISHIINADSMQIYKELPILTAIPNHLSENHHLYATQNYNDHYSMGRWFNDVTSIIDESEEDVFLIIGGTGLYIKALIYGMSSIPDVPRDIREGLQKKLEKIGVSEFYEYLGSIDKEGQKTIRKTDRQRMIRAAEVFLHTGKSIRSYNNEKIKSGYDFLHITLSPERKYLYDLCNRRFDQFLDSGALSEVEVFARKTQSDSNSYMLQNALGYRELCDFLTGSIALEDAATLAKQKTRNYAKRQVTWFKGQEEAEMFGFIEFSEILIPLEARVKSFLGL